MTDTTPSPDDAGFVARALQLDCAALSDALDRAGIVGQCYGISARDGGFRMAGHAYTVLYRPAAHDEQGFVGDFIDDVPPGSVITIDNRGRDDMGTWGNILTEMAHFRQMAGTVIDGINRDVALCRELNYPIYSRGHWMRTGKGRIQLAGLQVPVQIGGVNVHPGDLLRGDADGVVAIPRAAREQVLAYAEEITAKENAIRAGIRDGLRMDEARRLHHYHHLQSPAYGKAA
ncbi:RraA family protein [Xylophilus rhododendri]|uniref:Putative 4-hydroxy-4-methyl-2-oxoglutarate aldolase n=1 Tax=Xylophilus rhododendri TaxID=2697032 RepID=A0A857IZE6_9BURK|nr:RraA family protein [Xylophilus rhododendri]QHI96677.1 RraA family protein [Xylophilus rhododendri]